MRTLYCCMLLLIASPHFCGAQSHAGTAKTYTEVGLTPLTLVAPVVIDPSAPAVPLPFAGVGHSGQGSPLADTLLYLFSIADNNFKPIASQHLTESAVAVPGLQHLLGAQMCMPA